MAASQASSSTSRHPSREPRRLCLGYDTALAVLLQMPSHAFRANPPRKSDPSRPAPTKADFLRAEGQLQALLPYLPPGMLHAVVGTSRCRPIDRWHVHRCSRRIAGDSEVQIAEHLDVATAPAVFVQMATRISFVHLVELGYQLCGTYRNGLPSMPTAFDRPPLASVEQLSAFVRANPSLDGARQAKRALAYVSDGSASPRETKAAILFALPMRLGGYGLSVPLMNHKLDATREARSIAGRSSFRCDLFWKSAKLDVEYQSREFHCDEHSRIADSRRTNALRSMGYSVLSITNDELDSLSATDVIATTIARSCGKQFRSTVDRYYERKASLRRQLGLPIEPAAHVR